MKILLIGPSTLRGERPVFDFADMCELSKKHKRFWNRNPILRDISWNGFSNKSLLRKKDLLVIVENNLILNLRLFDAFEHPV